MQMRPSGAREGRGLRALQRRGRAPCPSPACQDLPAKCRTEYVGAHRPMAYSVAYDVDPQLLERDRLAVFLRIIPAIPATSSSAHGGAGRLAWAGRQRASDQIKEEAKIRPSTPNPISRATHRV